MGPTDLVGHLDFDVVASGAEVELIHSRRQFAWLAYERGSWVASVAAGPGQVPTVITVLAVILSLLGAYVVVGNWVLVFQVWRDPTRSRSLVPLVGGGSLLGAMLLLDRFEPLFLAGIALDWGTGLGLLTAPVFWLRHRMTAGADEDVEDGN